MRHQVSDDREQVSVKNASPKRGSFCCPPSSGIFPLWRTSHTAGFTLLELMVVLVVVGIMLGIVTLNSLPNKQQTVQRDAQRIALLLQLAREEAIVRNKQVAFEVDNEGYRFFVRDKDKWELLTDNDLFRQRSFDKAPLIITIQPNSTEEAIPLKIIFGREPVDKPFILTLTYEDVSASIRADGIGHFTVE